MDERNNRKKKLEIALYFFLLTNSMLLGMVFHYYSPTILLGILLSLPGIWFALKRDFRKPNKREMGLLAGNALICVPYLFSGIKYKVPAYILIAFTIMCIVPALQKHITRKSDESIMRLAEASGLFIIFFAALSFLSGRPITTQMFGGIIHNQNGLGFLCVAIMPGGLTLCRYGRRKLGLLVVGITFAFTIFSCSRTAIIGVFLQLIYAGFVLSRDVKWNIVDVGDACRRVLKILAVCIASFFILFWVFTTAKVYEAELFPKIQMQEKYERVISLSEFVDKLQGRAVQGLLDDSENYAFSSGRIGIWKDYWSNIEFLGHEKEEREFVTSGTRVYKSTNAHNGYLQVAYGAGILAGVGLVIVSLFAIYGAISKSLAAIRKKQISNPSFFAVLTALGYGVVIMTSSSWMMYVHLPALIFWPTVALLLTEEE